MIRIVAGKVGGRRLGVPKGSKVRPTADRVREALFSSLGSRVDNAKVLDLFAGTGAFGLEALSRGAASAVFVEMDRSVRNTLKENIDGLGFSADSEVVAADAIKAVSKLKNRSETFDIAFLDPPYAGGLLDRAIAAVCDAGILAPGALLVAEHPSDVALCPPKNLQKVSTRSYGDTGLTFFEWSGDIARRKGESSHMSLIALYPGSFDPFTNGHLGVTQRCLKVFDKVIIGIAQNSRKEAFFSVAERIDMIGAAMGNNPAVEVLAFEGLTINFAKKCGASAIVRGLRAVADFEYELQMANTNRKLNSNIETLFMMTSEEYFFVSSQNVKEVASLGGNISGLVPKIIAERVWDKLKSKGHVFPSD